MGWPLVRIDLVKLSVDDVRPVRALRACTKGIAPAILKWVLRSHLESRHGDPGTQILTHGGPDGGDQQGKSHRVGKESGGQKQNACNQDHGPVRQRLCRIVQFRE